MTADDIVPASVDEIDAEHGHWNHLLPVEDWERVVAEADRIYDERVAAETEKGGAELLPLGLTPRFVRFPDTHGKNSGKIVRQQLWVLHSAECPLRAGYAESLTRWGNGGYQPRASWQRFVDPATIVGWIGNHLAAFLHGPANSLGMGWEQAGYARFTRAEWLTPDGLRQMDLLAQDMVACGITPDAIRWLTDAQVKAIVERRDTKTRGMCTHAQIDKAVKAGLRTDPGKGYPYDVLVTWTRSYHPGVPSQTPPGTPGTVRIGDRGSQVVLVQEYLDALGYDVGKADGVAGEMFDAAVRAFQTNNGLDVDGVAGPNTLTQLRSKEAIMARLPDEDVQRIATAVRNIPIYRPTDPRASASGHTSLAQEVADAKTAAQANAAELGALKAAIAESGKGGPIDLDAIVRASEEGASRALEDLRLVKGDDGGGVRDIEDVDQMAGDKP